MEKHPESTQTNPIDLLLNTLATLHLEGEKDESETKIIISFDRDLESVYSNYLEANAESRFSDIEVSFTLAYNTQNNHLDPTQTLSEKASLAGIMKTLKDDIKDTSITRLHRQILTVAYLTIKRELEALTSDDVANLESLNEHENLATDYYHTLSRLSQDTPNEDLDKMEEILKRSQLSPELALLITEIDNLVLSGDSLQSLDKSNSLSDFNTLKRVFSILRTSGNSGLNEQLKILKDSQRRQKIAIEYFRLLSDLDKAESDSDVDRLCEIMHEAESDDALALVLNEIDSLLIQESETVPIGSGQIEKYEKFADCFREHVKASSDAGMSRLITKLSTLIEKLQALRSCDSFIDEDSTLDIDGKMYSLEELKKEAEVEQGRQIIQGSYECSKG